MRQVNPGVYSSRSADKFVVRLPEGMRERIAEEARASHRSMNSEIIARLEASLGEESIEKATTPHVLGPEVQWIPQTGMLVKALLANGAVAVGELKGFAHKLDTEYNTIPAGVVSVSRSITEPVAISDMRPFITGQ